jgi:hypothetical protein
MKAPKGFWLLRNEQDCTPTEKRADKQREIFISVENRAIAAVG